jgi:hypothetical protein
MYSPTQLTSSLKNTQSHGPPQAMADLPYDVWLHVASYIPIGDLNRLLTLNHAFFDFVMDKRYREFTFRYCGMEDIEHLIAELE